MTEYRNDGNGNFELLDETWEIHFRDISHTSVVDLDGDGDRDIVSRAQWLENIGGEFISRPVDALTDLDAEYLLHELTTAADLDGDGELDLVFASVDEFVGYLPNNGRQQFANEIAEVTEIPKFNVDDYVGSLDLDVDGQMDHLFAQEEQMVWFTGSIHLPFEHATVIPRLRSRAEGPERHHDQSSWHHERLVDLDQDGDTDILTIEAGPIAVWYVNDGNGGFTPQTPFEVSIPALSIRSVTPVFAVDRLGDTDVLVRWYSELGSHLALHKNLGGGLFADAEMLDDDNILYSSADDVGHKADFDGDGVDEILLSQPTSVWLFDDAHANLITHRTCSHYSGCATSGAKPADVDQDGDLDFWLLNRDGVVWLKNDGNAEFRRIRASTISARQLEDVDGDGDIDLLSGAETWFENVGSQQFLQHTSAVVRRPRIGTQRMADVDLDGDSDALWLDTRNNRISWTPNLLISNPGDANFDGAVSEQDFAILAANFGRADASWADGDFDGDGSVSFLDFLVLANNFRSEA